MPLRKGRARCVTVAQERRTGGTPAKIDNFGARYMSSNLGRFMSADDSKYVNPADPQTWNLYGYVANNPINSVDPTGHAPEYMMPHEPYIHPQGDGGPTAEGSGGSVETEMGEDFLASLSGNFGDDDEGSGGGNQKKPSAQDLAAQVPNDAKIAINAAVDASNSPSTGPTSTGEPPDTRGGLHEESLTWGIDGNRNVLISPSLPGPLAPPDKKAHTDFEPKDRKLTDRMIDIRGGAHVHPKGRDGRTFVQEPSDADYDAAFGGGRINIVVGAQNSKVYFYNDTSRKPIATMKLSDFMKGVSR